MNSRMFRGKESSNRIEISQLDLLNFGVLGSLQLWGGGRWVGGVWGHGGVTTHMYMHTNACIEMATDKDSSMFIMFNMHVHVCTCMCAWNTPLHTHTHPHPHAPICQTPGGTPGIGQYSITLELIKIFQFCLKI